MRLESLVAISIVSASLSARAADLQVTSLADSGTGTLRAALATAMGNSEADHITFTVAGTIQLQTPLPILGDPGCSGAPDCLVIDGGGTVILDGSAIPRPHAEGYGFALRGPGFVINGFVIASFERAGVLIDGVNAHGNRVSNCFIGTDASGQNASATSVVGDAGILIRGGATGAEIVDNVIAGYTPRSATYAAGIRITGSDTAGIQILGNTIGLAAGGGAPIGGSGHTLHIGIWIDSGAFNVMIGDGLAPNTIGNQLIAGVLAEGIGVNDVVLHGNFIGTDSTGTIEMPNGLGFPDTGGGVVFRGGPQIGRVGEVGLGNVISGNRNCQVRIDGAGPIEVVNNTIGAAGTATTQRLLAYGGGTPAGNVNGVCLEGGATGNIVGRGMSPLETNRIAFHDPIAGTCPPACGAAVLVTGAGTATNLIGGNYIGFVFDGDDLISGTAPNHYGILIMDGAGPNDVGQDPNQITGTSRAGVAVVGATTRGNALVHNWVQDNGTAESPGVEICLARNLNDCRAHGYTPDSTRANDGVLPPRFDAGAYFRSEPDIAFITGTVTEPGIVYLFRVPPTPSSSGFGGAVETVGEMPVTDAPYTFHVPFPIAPGTVECATAVLTTTGAERNGSELAANVRVVGGDRGPDDDGGPLSCRPVPPAGGDPGPTASHCSSGFDEIDGVCTRELGCRAAGGHPGLAWVVVMIWMRRRRHA